MMANPAAPYKIIGLLQNTRTVTRTIPGAPEENQMISWGKDKGCVAVIRYFPSKKGWRVLDIRNAVAATLGGTQRKIWQGQVRGDRYWPTEDAAMMYAIAKLAGHSSTL